MIATDHAAAFSKGGTCRARLEGLRLLPSRQQVLLAADWAAAALPVWEGVHPDDPRPRRAIEAARSGGRDAADAAYDAADAAAHAAAHAAHAADWSAVRRLWESAYHGGQVWRPEWGTPLAVELALDPQAYQILLDHLEDQGVPVEGLRGAGWTRSNWAVYHLLEGKP